MPGEPGELEAMSYAFRGCTGLQHEVIAMASCCKKGGDSPSREFRVLYLNNQNQLIAGETLFTGTINRTEVHPREVIKRAL